MNDTMRPILFNTAMVSAILEGRKTVTRRLVKPNFRPGECSYRIITEKYSGKYVRVEYLDEWEEVTRYMREPCQPGDILYVRETWAFDTGDDMDTIGCGTFLFRADGGNQNVNWRPSIHMPKEAARVFLRVKNVRAERLHQITVEEAQKEGVLRKEIRNKGCSCQWKQDGCLEQPCANRDAYESLCWTIPFAELWDSTTKTADMASCGWEANPWVWVIEFERISKKETMYNE